VAEVWLIEEGYYEDRAVKSVAATREAADRAAEALHPVKDHFFGSDPTCAHWQPKLNPEYPDTIDCAGCTVDITRWDVAE
jgi:hypothetical protein